VPPFLLLLLAFRLLLIFFFAFFICWVFEAGFGVVEPLLPEAPEPKSDHVEEARWREPEALAEAN